MSTGRRGSREGGIKVVFDVPDGHVDQVINIVADNGFGVHRYYPAGHNPPIGGAAHGTTRIGAERPRRFTSDEQARVQAAVEAVGAMHQLPLIIVGVDTWEASGNDGDSPECDREPRKPLPLASSGGSNIHPRARDARA